MSEKLFAFNDLEIWAEEGQFFAIYDAGSHQVVMRKDEITKDEAELACQGNNSAIEMLYALQKRLLASGVDPYISNYDGRR